MKIHHLGYAVNNINDSIIEFEKLGYTKISFVNDLLRNVQIAFMSNQDYLVDLIAPLNDKSPVDKVLLKMGSTPYHICYETHDIDSKVSELKNDGWMLIKKKEIAIAIDDNYVVFMYHKIVGLIELVEIKKEKIHEKIY